MVSETTGTQLPRVFYDGKFRCTLLADVDRIDLSQPGDSHPWHPGPDPSL
jgi:hypothetical protein